MKNPLNKSSSIRWRSSCKASLLPQRSTPLRTRRVVLPCCTMRIKPGMNSVRDRRFTQCEIIWTPRGCPDSNIEHLSDIISTTKNCAYRAHRVKGLRCTRFESSSDNSTHGAITSPNFQPTADWRSSPSSNGANRFNSSSLKLEPRSSSAVSSLFRKSSIQTELSEWLRSWFDRRKSTFAAKLVILFQLQLRAPLSIEMVHYEESSFLLERSQVFRGYEALGTSAGLCKANHMEF